MVVDVLQVVVAGCTLEAEPPFVFFFTEFSRQTGFSSASIHLVIKWMVTIEHAVPLKKSRWQ